MKNTLNKSWIAIVVAIVAVVGLSLSTNHNTPKVPIVTTVTPLTVESVDNVSITVNKAQTPKAIVQNLKIPAERTVVLIGEVDDRVLGLAEAIKQMGQTTQPIYLLINSPGGSVMDGAMVISAIEASKAPVYTVCLQLCASMAAMIHQYGAERMMVDRSILMFHDASGGVQGPVPQMLSRLNMINNFVNKTDKFVAARAGIDLDVFHNRAHAEIWLDAEDATKEKFNDKIVNVLLPLATEQSMKATPKSEPKVKPKFDLDWI